MNIYIYIERGYTCNGYGNYGKITVVECEGEAPLSWANKKCRMLRRTLKLNIGKTQRSAMNVKVGELLADYPTAKIVTR